jgi:hypothetical protein
MRGEATLSCSRQAFPSVFTTLGPEGPAFRRKANHREAEVRAVFATRQPVSRQGGKSLTMYATLSRSRHALTSLFATLGPEGPAFKRQADQRETEVRAVFAACRQPVSRQGAVFATLGPEGPAFRRQANHMETEVRGVFAARQRPVSRQMGQAADDDACDSESLTTHRFRSCFPHLGRRDRLSGDRSPTWRLR